MTVELAAQAATKGFFTKSALFKQVLQKKVFAKKRGRLLQDGL
jgi:hypothetical protein